MGEQGLLKGACLEFFSADSEISLTVVDYMLRMIVHLSFKEKIILAQNSRYLSVELRPAVVEVVELRNYVFHLTFSCETFVEK